MESCREEQALRPSSTKEEMREDQEGISGCGNSSNSWEEKLRSPQRAFEVENDDVARERKEEARLREVGVNLGWMKEGEGFRSGGGAVAEEAREGGGGARERL